MLPSSPMRKMEKLNLIVNSALNKKYLEKNRWHMHCFTLFIRNTARHKPNGMRIESFKMCQAHYG